MGSNERAGGLQIAEALVLHRLAFFIRVFGFSTTGLDARSVPAGVTPLPRAPGRSLHALQ